jgi:hypothetical protein
MTVSWDKVRMGAQSFSFKKVIVQLRFELCINPYVGGIFVALTEDYLLQILCINLSLLIFLKWGNKCTLFKAHNKIFSRISHYHMIVCHYWKRIQFDRWFNRCNYLQAQSVNKNNLPWFNYDNSLSIVGHLRYTIFFYSSKIIQIGHRIICGQLQLCRV